MKVLPLMMAMLFFPTLLHSQSGSWSDEVWCIDGWKKLSHPFKKWKPEFQLDARRTILPSANIQIGGARLGAEYKRVHRFGIGVYSWASNLNVGGLDFPVENAEEFSYEFSYSSLYYERVLFFNRKWEVAATAHLGSGTIKRSYKPIGESGFEALDPIEIRPLELSTSGFYHITWWLSIGGGVGYRWMRDAPAEISTSFNAPVYVVKLKFRIGRLVKSIFNEEVKNEY